MNASAADQPLLTMTEVYAVYGRMSVALSGVTLTVPKNSIIALLGANAAGKTTTLKSISNLISLDNGHVSAGEIIFDGQEIQRGDPEYLVSKGIVQVLEGRRCFSHLTVEENLEVSCKRHRNSKRRNLDKIEEIYEIFPRLKARSKSQAGYISGGEQQMLVIGRAILAEPKLLLLDEPSMGIAPIVLSEIYEMLSRLCRERGFSILLAEQSTHLALSYSEYGYILGNGRVVQQGTSEELRMDPRIREYYLGNDDGESDASYEQSERANTWMI